MSAGTWLERLTAIAAKSSRLVAGVMSGTSMDSMDVALCVIGERRDADTTRTASVQLIAFHQEPYEEGLVSRLSNASSLTVRDVSELDVLIGEAFAAACLNALKEADLDAPNVDLIGSHGQTVYHHSHVPGAIRSTLQLGDADVIAARTGVAVISDFRARDIAEGGEGAPLTPYADVSLYGLDRSPHRAVLNLGGIANITFVERGSARKVVGFDTGPANAPLDRLALLLSGGSRKCDVDGAFASAGCVNSEMLRFLLQDDYLLTPPPKSTGFEVYGAPFVESLQSRFGPVSEDMIATVTEFVAQTIADALRRHVIPRADIDEIVVAGGGGCNPELMRRLRNALSPIILIASDALGVPAQAREAMEFALLANDALLGLRTSIPAVTGAGRAAVLGKLSFPG